MTFEEAELTLEAMEANARKFADPQKCVIGISEDQVWPDSNARGLIVLNPMKVTCKENSCDYTIGRTYFTRRQFILILSTHIETTWSRYMKRLAHERRITDHRS